MHANLRRSLCPVVLDAELVVTDRVVFWIIDMVRAGGTSLVDSPFYMRKQQLKLLMEALTLCTPGSEGGIVFARKGWWDASMARTVLNDPLNVPNDGLIFMRADGPYVPRRDPTILKWKPPEEVTVDFRVTSDYKLQLGDFSAPDEAMGPLLNPSPELVNIAVECRWDSKAPGWIAVRQRKDKLPRGNAPDAYRGTVRVIMDNLESEEVFRALEATQHNF
jgi:hypothetical protein